MISRNGYQKSKMIYMLAIAILFVGCSDKRGFKAKTVKDAVFNPLDVNPKPQDDDDKTPQAPLRPIEEVQEEQKIVNEEVVEDAKGKTTIVYNEVGEEEKLNEAEATNLTSSLIELAQRTAGLTADLKVLKGLSLNLVSETDTEALVEVLGLIRLENVDYNFTTSLTVKKGERVLSGQVKWVGAQNESLKVSVLADCSEKAENKCVQFSLGVVVDIKDKDRQGYLMFLDRSETGFTLGLGSEGLVSFEAAQNGVDATVTPEEEAKAEEKTEQQPEEQPEQQQEEQTDNGQQDAKQDDKVGTTPSGPSHRQAELNSMKAYEEMKKADAAKKDQTAATPSGPSHRQAELNSMKAYEEMKKTDAAKKRADLQDKEAARVQAAKRTRALSQREQDEIRDKAAKKAQTAATPSGASHRQAELNSMKAYEEMKKTDAAKKRADLQDKEAARVQALNSNKAKVEDKRATLQDKEAARIQSLKSNKAKVEDKRASLQDKEAARVQSLNSGKTKVEDKRATLQDKEAARIQALKRTRALSQREQDEIRDKAARKAKIEKGLKRVLEESKNKESTEI